MMQPRGEARVSGPLHLAIAVFGMLNAVLYCSLLPLWDGFDEPFHYGYVQALAVHRTFPVLGKTILSEEIWQSLHLAPASHVVKRNLPFVTTFGEFAALPERARRELRQKLRNLPPAWREIETQGGPNYEAQQAPLGYVVLSAADQFWRNDPLLSRLLKIRFVAALAACLLQFSLIRILARQLGLNRRATATALFLVLSSQMFYAATAHVTNDWLAIPLTTLVVVAALRFYEDPCAGTSAFLGAAIAAGLLTKAYFLSWALFAAMLVLWLTVKRHLSFRVALPAALAVAGLAGPWYIRNLLLYETVSGMQQSSGAGPAQVLRAAMELPWEQALLSSARGAIWTGNNSFTSFSSITVDAVLLLLAAGTAIGLWALRKSTRRGPQIVVAGGCLGFLAALLYANAVFFAFTKGGTFSATPWYPQALAAPLACLFCLGLESGGVAGQMVRSLLCLFSAYLIGATYFVKLLPLYGGYGEGSTRLIPLLHWYSQDPSRWRSILSDTALGNSSVILSLALVVAVMSAGLCFLLCRDSFRTEKLN